MCTSKPKVPDPPKPVPPPPAQIATGVTEQGAPATSAAEMNKRKRTKGTGSLRVNLLTPLLGSAGLQVRK